MRLMLQTSRPDLVLMLKKQICDVYIKEENESAL